MTNVYCHQTMTLKRRKNMTKQEALSALTPIMDKYLSEIILLTEAATRISHNPKTYTNGIKDGVTNTSLVAFKAGAKAMYDLLTKEHNGTSNNI